MERQVWSVPELPFNNWVVLTKSLVRVLSRQKRIVCKARSIYSEMSEAKNNGKAYISIEQSKWKEELDDTECAKRDSGQEIEASQKWCIWIQIKSGNRDRNGD